MQEHVQARIDDLAKFPDLRDGILVFILFFL